MGSSHISRWCYPSQVVVPGEWGTKTSEALVGPSAFCVTPTVSPGFLLPGGKPLQS